MLILQGKLRAVAQLGGGVNRKTGQAVPLRDVLQVEIQDERGLFQVETITVPDPKSYTGKEGQTVNIPVRAWATGGAQVRYSYAETPR